MMGKYSSESDNEKRRSKNSHKNRNNRRRSTSSSDSNNGELRSRKKRNKKNSSVIKDHHRSSSSNGRDRYSKSRYYYKSKSCSSRRSHSRESTKYNKFSRKSVDRHRKSRSRDKSRLRRSRSRSYIKEYKTNKVKRSTSSTSSSSTSSSDSNSSNNNNKGCNNNKGQVKSKFASKSNSVSNNNNVALFDVVVNKTPAAPAAATLPIKNDKDVEVNVEILNEINDDIFTQKLFKSSTKSKKNRMVPDNIVIDLKKQTIKVAEVEPIEPDSIFHHNLFLNEEARMEKWVKELYSYRQKALQQGLNKTNSN